MNDIQPSAFGYYVMPLLVPQETVIDLGCGIGRDTRLFAGKCKVIGIDGSKTAIDFMKQQNIPLSQFFCEQANNLPVGLQADAIYSRFFFHSISANEETQVVDWIKNTLLPGGMLFAEFRIEKKTGNHYRRSVDLRNLSQKLVRQGFETVYITVGHFSPIEGDDPLLARIEAKIRC